jgi:hypothetical protein
MLLPKRILAGAWVAATTVAACGGGNAASQLAKAPEYQPRDQTKCGVEKSQARPLIVEWPSADRQELEGKVRQGVVAVRYHGCEMDVLERCSVPVKYGYLGTTRAQDKVVMKDEDDLYANLPVGAARLEGKLQRSGQLTVDMNLVGRYEAQKVSVGADELQGDCAGATHFIYGVSVGAFDFYAGADASVAGGVGVGGVGAGGSSQTTRETLTKNGDPDACAKATSADKTPPEGCGALIRIEVVPLAGVVPSAAAAGSCPGGQMMGSTCVPSERLADCACTPWSTAKFSFFAGGKAACSGAECMRQYGLVDGQCSATGTDTGPASPPWCYVSEKCPAAHYGQNPYALCGPCPTGTRDLEGNCLSEAQAAACTCRTWSDLNFGWSVAGHEVCNGAGGCAKALGLTGNKCAVLPGAHDNWAWCYVGDGCSAARKGTYPWIVCNQ